MVFSSLQGIADFLFTPVLKPLLSFPPVVTILAVALFVSLVSVLAQRQFTDQARLKFLKKETKKLQEDIRKYKDDADMQLKINKKIMPIQGEMMRESLKPTLWMMIPFLLLFLWLSAHFAFEPLAPNETFTVQAEVREGVSVLLEAPAGVQFLSPQEAEVVEGVARWSLIADAGHYALTLLSGDDIVTKHVLVTAAKEYEQPVEHYQGAIRTVTVDNKALKPIDPFTIFGWRPGWIWVYIFFSLVFSIGLRKWLDVA